ncbi:uncharacterized protein C16orf78-like [Octopus sinensis]|uniref:Uncharacterized protein C16orf78-like n=1 Tax=Octopus sinensis TaxID=2607531 RepID=A0A7E6FQS4_9MOLL|nr:uncharacterized protein C16orf78-like [Octopus sinensis]
MPRYYMASSGSKIMDSKREDYKKKSIDTGSRTNIGKKSSSDNQKPSTSRKEFTESANVKTGNETRQSFVEFRKQGIPFLVPSAIQLAGRQRMKPSDAILTPKEVLDCSYLRLSEAKIKELEQACRDRGTDPGIHKHMSFDELNKVEIFEKASADDNPAERKGSRHRGVNVDQRGKL